MSKIPKVQQKALLQIQAQRQKQRIARQVAISRDIREMEESGFNIVLMRRNFKKLEEQKSIRRLSKSRHAEDEVEKIEETTNIEDSAARFNKNNFELDSKKLIDLRNSISDADTVEDILRKVLETYPDYTLADEALDFLLQTTKGNLAIKVQKAKDFLNTNFKREIVAGKNINLQALTFSKEGLGSPTNLRDMYRDITGNPRTPHTLFDELSEKYPFEKIKAVIRFLLHSLGMDMKSKGPSITRPELIRLMEDTQMLQAILSVYKFFQLREKLIGSQFDHFGLFLPESLNFELLSKIFINLLKERYVTLEKILMHGKLLRITEEIIAQIIIYTQMKDALRNTSLKLYKSEKHRQETLDAFMELLEELEEKLEEEEEEEMW